MRKLVYFILVLLLVGCEGSTPPKGFENYKYYGEGEYYTKKCIDGKYIKSIVTVGTDNTIIERIDKLPYDCEVIGVVK